MSVSEDKPEWDKEFEKYWILCTGKDGVTTENPAVWLVQTFKVAWDIQQRKIDEFRVNCEKQMLENHRVDTARAEDFYNKLQIAIEALKSATNRSFYEGANKKECVDLCISWAKRVLEEVK